MSDNMTFSERFLSAFNEIEGHLKSRYGRSINANFGDNLEEAARKSFAIRSYKEELKAYASLRNAIVHNSMRRIINPIAEPHKEIVEDIERIIREITKPKTAYESIAVRRTDMFCVDCNSIIFEVMKTMRKKKYSYVPIVENGALVGVFSENTLFSYIIDNEIFMLEQDMVIDCFKDYTALASHDNEMFVFVSKKESVYDVVQRFQQDTNAEKRIGALFITENGKQNESLLGLVTPWDIIKFTASMK